MYNFTEMLLHGYGKYIRCENCIYYKEDECRLNPLSVSKKAKDACGQFLSLEDKEKA